MNPVVVLTGAGISAESGVPTFRGEGGLWENHHPEDLATSAAFQRDPELVWRFYAWRRELIAGSGPNRAHLALAEMERAISDFTVITQNIDGLHSAAGNMNLIELHGSIWRLRCTACSHRWDDRQVPLPELMPACPQCGGLARPDVVWFGESLDSAVLHSAIKKSKAARLVFVVGTSSIVQPAAELPILAKRSGATLIEINPAETPLSGFVDRSIRENASDALPRLWRRELEPSLR